MPPRTPAPPEALSNPILAVVTALALALVATSVPARVGPAPQALADGPGVPARAQAPGVGAQDAAAPPVWPAGSGRLSLAGQSRWWPAAAAADLVATRAQVVLRPGLAGMTTDRSGALWLHGPWLVARVDPRTGSATQWGPGQDAAFAGVTGLHPGAEAGVWLMAPERLRLFDGDRFVRDMAVPARYRGGSAITDVVDLGSEVWVSSAGGVARCVEGVWSPVASDQLTDVSALTVDGAGVVWAAGRLAQSTDSRLSVVRFASGRWQRPDGRQVPGAVRDLVGDPRGAGVLVRTRTKVGRLTSTGWRRLTESGTDHPRDLAIAGDGRVWVLDARTIRHPPRAGRWRTVARGRLEAATALALVDDELWVADTAGLLHVTDRDLRRVWTADLPAPVAPVSVRGRAAKESSAAAGQPLSVPVDRVLVGSRDRVYATVDGYPHPFRFTGQGWQELVLDAGTWSGRPVLASDGAIWIPTALGPVRAGRGRPRLVPVTATDDVLYPDRSAGVWATPAPWYGWWYAQGAGGADPAGRGLTHLRPDGPAGQQVPLPRGVWQLTGLYPGAGETLWATSCAGRTTPDRCSTAPDLDLWDGRGWSAIPYPGTAVSGIGVAALAFWALIWADDAPDAEPVLARYSGGDWTTLPQVGVLESPTVTVAGLVCGGQDMNRTVACVDASGGVSRRALEVGELLAVGPDGSVWVGGDGALARLAGELEP